MLMMIVIGYCGQRDQLSIKIYPIVHCIGIDIVVGLKISMKIMLKYNSIYMVFVKCQKIYRDSSP